MPHSVVELEVAVLPVGLGLWYFNPWQSERITEESTGSSACNLVGR
jgi:hypothetical protein